VIKPANTTTLKIKNGTTGALYFHFIHPQTRNRVDIIVEPMSTIPFFTGLTDECSQIVNQWDGMIPFDTNTLHEAPYQIIWGDALPNIDDYIGSLESGENIAAKDSKKAIKQAVEGAADGLNSKGKVALLAGDGKEIASATGADKE
jgi:hypothetical protein